MRALKLIPIFGFPFFAWSAPVKDIRQLTLIHQHGSQVQIVEMPYAHLEPNSSYTLVHPDTSLNPAKHKQKWSGQFFKSILTKAKINPPSNSEITIVGSDDYLAQIDFGDVVQFSPLLATHKDDRKIEWREGGASTIFPVHLHPNSLWFQKAHWWVWTVSAVFVGRPSPILSVKKGTITKPFDLSQELGARTKTSNVLNPEGHRKNIAIKGEVKVSYWNLSDFLKTRGVAPSQEIIVETYNGRSEVLKASDSHELVFLWNGQSIPPSLGGPIQVCVPMKALRCLYFVRSLNIQ